MRVVEVTVLAAIGASLVGLAAVALDRPAPNAYAARAARVSASSTWTQEGFDAAFLVDGVRDHSGAMWASQYELEPWVRLELPQPTSVQRVDVYALAGRKGVRAATELRGECDGAAFSLTPADGRLVGDLGGRSCTALTLRGRVASLREKIGIAEIEVVGVAP